MKRILTVLVFALMLAGILGSASFADSEMTCEVFDTNALKEYLNDAFMRCESNVDVSSFDIANTQENKDILRNLIFNELPECFHVESYSNVFYPDQITAIVPTYRVSEAEYKEMYSEITSVKEKILKEIKDNDSLGEVEKALLIHDRLALQCEYDFNNTPNNADIYGALAVGKAVCQGYADAYEYLLDEVGIDSYICSSKALNHAWNIVYINGVPYHVDVTWDDDSWNNGGRGVVGGITHDNFLRSSAGIYQNEHTANDYDNTPCDTTYDNHFWQNSDAAFQLVGQELYYIDSRSQKLMRYGDQKVLCDLTDVWRSNQNSYWTRNYARLSSGGNYLFYSLSKGVYKFDLLTQTAEKVYTPDLSGYNSIYGFEYSDGYFVCDVNNLPPYEDPKGLYQIKEFYGVLDDSDSLPFKFDDVKSGKWYTEAVYYCYDNGYMAGVSKYVFGYKETVTRAMFATVLAKIDGSDLSSYTEMSFDDVKGGKWYSNSIEWAYQNGYAAGLGDGVFGYKNEVTREQIAMFFYTYSEKTGIDVSGRANIEGFADYARIHGYALNAMAWAVDAELIAGTGENCVSPRESATRSEIALIVTNYVKTVKESE